MFTHLPFLGISWISLPRQCTLLSVAKTHPHHKRKMPIFIFWTANMGFQIQTVLSINNKKEKAVFFFSFKTLLVCSLLEGCLLMQKKNNPQYVIWRAGATVGGYEESGKGIQKTVLFRSFQRLWLLFLFFSLKTCQDIKDDLVAENILILWKREWEQERESERRGYFINTAFNTYLKWRLSNFENMVNFLIMLNVRHRI